MVRSIVLTLVSLAALPATANAALPAAHPPPKSVAGVKLAWPKSAQLAPGAKLSVKVSSSHRRVSLTLARVDGRTGVAMRAVARRTLRSGTFTVTLPGDTGATYALRATVAGKRYWSWFRAGVTCSLCHEVIKAPGPAPAPVPAPASAPISIGGCTQPAPVGDPVYGLDIDEAAVIAGTEFSYHVTNSGPVDGGVYSASWQYQAPGGAWAFFAASLTQQQTVPAGGSVERRATLPASAPAGSYRLVEWVNAPGQDPCSDAYTLIGMTSDPIVVP